MANPRGSGTPAAVHAGKPVVLTCTCSHDYQDSRYGKGKRVHNPCKLLAGSAGHRCTVCGRTR